MKKENHKGPGLAAAIFLLFILLAATAQAATPMPPFALPSATDGATVNSDDYRGKVLIINFFATWCPPCRKEIPSFVELQKEYGPKGFSVIGISTDQGGSQLVAKFMQKMKINYPVVMADYQVPRDFGNILGIPTSFLVDRQGNILKRYDGYVGHSVLVRELDTILR